MRPSSSREEVGDEDSHHGLSSAVAPAKHLGQRRDAADAARRGATVFPAESGRDNGL